MYTFDDRGESVTLRPENTASLVRAYIEHNVNQQEPETKWWYLGPMFRRERQQRGRYRQFPQIGVDAAWHPAARIATGPNAMRPCRQSVFGPSLFPHLSALCG